jgi:hypothetical protein
METVKTTKRWNHDQLILPKRKSSRSVRFQYLLPKPLHIQSGPGVLHRREQRSIHLVETTLRLYGLSLMAALDYVLYGLVKQSTGQ